MDFENGLFDFAIRLLKFSVAYHYADKSEINDLEIVKDDLIKEFKELMGVD